MWRFKRAKGWHFGLRKALQILVVRSVFENAFRLRVVRFGAYYVAGCVSLLFVSRNHALKSLAMKGCHFRTDSE